MPDMKGRKLLAAGLDTSLRLIEACAKRLAEDVVAASSAPEFQEERDALRKVVLAMSACVSFFVDLASDSTSETLLKLTSWIPTRWTTSLLSCFEAFPARVANFTLHAGIVKIILDLGSARRLEPRLRGDDRLLIQTLTDKVRLPGSRRRRALD